MSQRFSISGELNRVDHGLTHVAQKEWGTAIEWYRYDENASVVDDLYDVGASRAWKPPLLMPALWATREEGRDTHDQDGLYTTDVLRCAVAMHAMRDLLHWTDLPETIESFLKDRIRYDHKVFTVASFQLQGQLGDRDAILGITAHEVRDDQFVFDVDFPPT